MRQLQSLGWFFCVKAWNINVSTSEWVKHVTKDMTKMAKHIYIDDNQSMITMQDDRDLLLCNVLSNKAVWTKDHVALS